MKKRILSSVTIIFTFTLMMLLLLPGATVMADPLTFGFNTEETAYDNTISDTVGGYTLQIASSDSRDIVTNWGIEIAAASGDYAYLAPLMDGCAVYVGYLDWDTSTDYKPKGTITVSLTGGQAFSLDSFVCGIVWPGTEDYLTLTAGSTTEKVLVKGLHDNGDDTKVLSPPTLITPSDKDKFQGITSFTLSWEEKPDGEGKPNPHAMFFDNFKITPTTYTIAPIGDQTLAGLTAGYTSGAQETKPLTITKTGTGDLTNLAVALDGTNAGDFIVTQPAVTTLNSDTTSTTFTVKARDGLTAGTYTATVTISADNMTPVNFTVTQRVDTYTIAPIGNQTFAGLTVGYTSGTQETKTLTITKTGTGDLANLAVALGGKDAGDFILTQPADRKSVV
jgi:hypothetical protein